MLSEQCIEHKLVWEFLQKQRLEHLKEQWLHSEQLTNKAKEMISELVNLKETHYIEIPIYNLMLLENERELI